MIRSWCAVLVLQTLAALPLCAQAPVFRADARIVPVHVTVHSSRGEMISTLDQAAFTVYEDGKRQPITLFLRDDMPVSLGIVIDNSGSMRQRRARVEAAALGFARASHPLDELFVVNFADRPRVDVPFTSDIRVLESGIARIDSIGGTAIRDALAMATGYLVRHAARDRKVLLVITDGDDNASTLSTDQIREQSERAGISVYAIGLPHDDSRKAARARRDLDDLTEPTGGMALHPATLDDIESTAVRLARQIRQQYTLAYAPLNQTLDGAYRRIRIAVKAPARVTVRHRAGYYATADRPVGTMN